MINWKDFVLQCAKNFITDFIDYENTSIPDMIVIDASYTRDVASSHIKYEELLTYSSNEIEAAAAKAYEELCKTYQKSFFWYIHELARLTTLLANIEQWHPHTDFMYLKEFALEKVKEEIHSLIFPKLPIRESPIVWYRKALETAQMEKLNCITACNKEEERIRKINSWLRDLRESLYG